MLKKHCLYIILTLWSSFSFAEAISYPKCKQSESLKTPIQFYLPTKVLDARSKDEVYHTLNK